MKHNAGMVVEQFNARVDGNTPRAVRKASTKLEIQFWDDKSYRYLQKEMKFLYIMGYVPVEFRPGAIICKEASTIPVGLQPPTPGDH